MKRFDLFFASLLVPIDIVMIFLAFILSYSLRINLEGVPDFANTPLYEYLLVMVYLLPLWIGIFSLNGLYSIKRESSFFSQCYRLFLSSSTAILFLIVIIYLSKTLFFSRIILISAWILSITFLLIGRLIHKYTKEYFLKRGIGQSRIMLIGNNEASEKVAKFITDRRSLGMKLVGVINTDQKKINTLKSLGTLENIASSITKYGVDEVILTDNLISKATVMEIIEICSGLNVSFKYLPDLYSLLTQNFKPSLFGSMAVMELRQIPLDGWGRIIKRFFDIFFSLFFLVILSPIIALISLLVKLSSRGPVMYKHKRVGRDESSFDFYKFRSMYLEECDYRGGVKWTDKEAENTRVTKIGRILRKTNLDELPQLWNILKGDMSFVGPRPELPKFVEKFEREIPDYFRRHRVKSGLTGWAQVNGLKGDTSISERVKYDIFYIENWSLWFDLKIILRTVILTINEAVAGKTEYRSGS